MTTIELRPDAAASVEDLISRIAGLVLERQTLRSHDAHVLLLERNRTELVNAHHDLSRALIARHLPPKAETAEVAA